MVAKLAIYSVNIALNSGNITFQNLNERQLRGAYRDARQGFVHWFTLSGMDIPVNFTRAIQVSHQKQLPRLFTYEDAEKLYIDFIRYAVRER